jgi:hypothetical protein
LSKDEDSVGTFIGAMIPAEGFWSYLWWRVAMGIILFLDTLNGGEKRYGVGSIGTAVAFQMQDEMVALRKSINERRVELPAVWFVPNPSTQVNEIQSYLSNRTDPNCSCTFRNGQITKWWDNSGTREHRDFSRRFKSAAIALVIVDALDPASFQTAKKFARKAQFRSRRIQRAVPTEPSHLDCLRIWPPHRSSTALTRQNNRTDTGERGGRSRL